MTRTTRWQDSDDAFGSAWRITADALMARPGHDERLRRRFLRSPHDAWEFICITVARAHDEDAAAEVASELLAAWPMIRTGQHIPPGPSRPRRHRESVPAED
ncbi:MAG: hypothetical protein AAGJ38_07540 [Planctomycetota bacterium]